MKNFESDLKNFDSGFKEFKAYQNFGVKDKEQNNPFMCPICQIDFKARIKIEEHFLMEHEGIKPYHCSVCDARFSYQRTLTSHVYAG